MEIKVCTKCERELSIDNFYKDKGHLRSRCKDCMRTHRNQYAKDNAKIIAERSRQHYAENKKKFIKKSQLYQKNNKETLAKKKKQRYENNKDFYLFKMKKYNDVNKKVIIEQRKRHYNDNKESITEKSRQYRDNNKKYVAEYQRRYCKEHLEKYRIYAQKRRGTKLLLPSTLTNEQWTNIKQHFNNKCAYCGKELPLAQDHFIPLSKGGEYTINNIIPSCKSCNCSKSNKDFFEWYPKYRCYSKKREKYLIQYLGYTDGKQQLKINY